MICNPLSWTPPSWPLPNPDHALRQRRGLRLRTCQVRALGCGRSRKVCRPPSQSSQHRHREAVPIDSGGQVAQRVPQTAIAHG
eukprot:5099731-Pyramimonas_sp.AAC.1